MTVRYTDEVRKVKAINAMKKMEEISVALGNDKLTLAVINEVIKSTREKIKNRQWPCVNTR